MGSKKIKCILFDMDGVLIDAKDWHYEALNQALSLFGITISRYEHIHSFDGLPTKEKLKRLSEEVYLPAPLHSFINEMKQIYTMNFINENCRPVFQHEYALSRLKKEGYLLAVCSNSVRHSIKVMMKKAALDVYLDEIFSNEDVTHSKPDPEIYMKAMEKMNMKPSECLILEDNKNGIRAAEDSGGNVMKIKDVWDVNYKNIVDAIAGFERESL